MMTAKKIIISAVLCALLLITPMITVGVYALKSPMQYDETFLGELSDKLERLDTLEGPRVILIGGSSMAFGLDSALLESYIGMPCVNFGLYATIGTKAMLDLSRSYIREGDMILICPETDPQTYSLYYNGKSMWQAIDCSHEILKHAGWDNAAKLIASLPEFAAEKHGFVSSGKKPSPSGIYAHASFNELGDISVLREYNEMPSFYDEAQPLSLNADLVTDEFTDYLNDYAAYAERKGAKVYFGFSPINVDAVVSTDKEIDAFYRTLGEKLDFKLISDVHDYILPSSYFFDTNFHLNTRGAATRTALLADDILRELGKTEYVETIKYSVPKRPDNYFDLQIKDDDNAIYFTFADTPGGLRITGLTEEGKQKETLTIPRAHDYKAVLIVGDNAFAESTVLKTVIFPENALIKSLTTDAFSGCTTLSRIEIAEKPDQINAGSETLSKMPKGCYVYISDEMYGDFATDYFWSSLMQYVKVAGETSEE